MEPKWPVLSYENGKDTYDTLHMWTQILGKIKLGTLPWINHSWHVTLKITPKGLTTSTLPYRDQFFQLDLDLVNHLLITSTSKGEIRQFELSGLSVADFYEKLFTILKELNIDLEIYSRPVELPNPIRFEEDTLHATYEKEQATALHKALLAVQDVFIAFRCHFKGKCSEVQFFWGSFDMAVSRFSGRTAPKHPGGIPNLANWVAEEAYSHEVMSAGFWPGSEILPEAAFYCYLYPEPEGYKDANIEPKEAYYHQELREFILPYKVVQESEDPEGKLREFLDSTYEVGARLANWDRNALED